MGEKQQYSLTDLMSISDTKMAQLFKDRDVDIATKNGEILHGVKVTGFVESRLSDNGERIYKIVINEEREILLAGISNIKLSD